MRSHPEPRYLGALYDCLVMKRTTGHQGTLEHEHGCLTAGVQEWADANQLGQICRFLNKVYLQLCKKRYMEYPSDSPEINENCSIEKINNYPWKGAVWYINKTPSNFMNSETHDFVKVLIKHELSTKTE